MAVKPMYRDGYGDFQDEDGVIFGYVCDSESDVSSLPTGENESDWTKKPRPGSYAVVADTGNVYLLNTQRIWKNITK